jgi:hypothetical protein
MDPIQPSPKKELSFLTVLGIVAAGALIYTQYQFFDLKKELEIERTKSTSVCM